MVTEDTRETAFLFQRLSIALQRGNVVSFLSTFTAVVSLFNFLAPQALSWWAIIIIITRPSMTEKLIPIFRHLPA